MIHKEDIDKIFEAARVEEVVGDYVTLKKRGVNLIGLCPFHDEKTPSFYVSPVKGIYKCFGCGKGGHAINFVMEKELMSYPDALRHLAKKYNIHIVEEEQSPEQLQSQNDRESLFVVSSFAQKNFQLGYCLTNRSAFTDIAIRTGYKAEYLVKAGLTFEYKNENPNPSFNEDAEILASTEKAGSKLLDRFWGRVMFPIHNASGRVIAFGGRTLRTDKKTAKYINSPETDIYHKSDVLYGLFFAKKEIIEQKNCFLVEGYTDVISMHQSGIENVVSFRGIDLILEEGMNVKVLLFPDGEDPDSYSKRVSSEELKTFVKNNSKDFISFKTNLLMGDVQNDPIKKAGLIKEIVESIALIPEAIYRSVYVKECSRIMDMEEQILLNELNKIRSKKFNEKSNSHIQSPKNIEGDGDLVIEEKKEEKNLNAEPQERKIIELLINHGNKNILVDSEDEDGTAIQVESTIAHLIIAELQNDAIVLDNMLFKSIYNEYVEQLEKNNIPDNKFFLYHENNAISSLTIDLMSSPHVLSNWERHSIYTNKEEDDLKKTAIKTVYTLKSCRIEIMINDINKQMKDCTSDDEIIQLQQVANQLLKAKISLNAFLGRIVVK
ncbi:MAG: toprim domain-containing protein [Bacteroidetes bacterium]|nr:toprim domain-containing protein [Bacteroidota bacterium]